MAIVDSDTCAVYWLFDDNCFDPRKHGYIGITTRWPHRILDHKKRKDKAAKLFPAEFNSQLLFVGSTFECMIIEYTLRPERYIGWNIERGGRHATKGRKRTQAEKDAISAGTKAAGGLTPAQRQRQKDNTPTGEAHHAFGKPQSLSAIEKNRAAQLTHDWNGERNGFFGRQHSEKTKALMRKRWEERRATMPPKPKPITLTPEEKRERYLAARPRGSAHHNFGKAWGNGT